MQTARFAFEPFNVIPACNPPRDFIVGYAPVEASEWGNSMLLVHVPGDGSVIAHTIDSACELVELNEGDLGNLRAVLAEMITNPEAY
jgi:hypothetical protein